MSNIVLGVDPLITSITINGVVKVPDGNGQITIPSADATAILNGQITGDILGPLWVVAPPTGPTT